MKRVLALLPVLLLAVPATAVTVTLEFSATVDDIDPGQFSGASFDTFRNSALGDTLLGKVTYDSTLVDTDPSPTRSSYNLFFGGASLEYSIGGASKSHTAFGGPYIYQFSVENDVNGGDKIHLLIESGSAWVLEFTLTDSTGTALNSDVLPESLDLSDWDGGRTYIYGGGHSTSVGAAINVRSVPDGGATAALLGLGVAGLALVRRNRS